MFKFDDAVFEKRAVERMIDSNEKIKKRDEKYSKDFCWIRWNKHRF